MTLAATPGARSPSPLRGICVTGLGLLVIRKIDASLSPAVVGAKAMSNVQESVGMTTASMQRSLDTGNICGVPETTSTCWIWAGKSPVLVTVNGRGPEEAPISTGPKARPWGFTEVIGPVSAFALIGIVVGVEALSESITRLAEAGPEGATGLKATPRLHELKALSSRPAQSP